jgi:hypothetical protein
MYTYHKVWEREASMLCLGAICNGCREGLEVYTLQQKILNTLRICFAFVECAMPLM